MRAFHLGTNSKNAQALALGARPLPAFGGRYNYRGFDLAAIAARLRESMRMSVASRLDGKAFRARTWHMNSDKEALPLRSPFHVNATRHSPGKEVH